MKWFVLIVVIGLLGVAVLAIGTGRVNAILEMIPIELPGRAILPGFGKSETEVTKEGETGTPTKPGLVATGRRKLGELLTDVPIEQIGTRVIRRIQQLVPPLKDKKISLVGLNYNLGTWFVILIAVLLFTRYVLPFLISLSRSGVGKSVQATGRRNISLPSLPKNLHQGALWAGLLTIFSGLFNLGIGEIALTKTNNDLWNMFISFLNLLASLGPVEAGLLTAFTILYSFAYIIPSIWESLKGANFLGRPTLAEGVGSAMRAVLYFVMMVGLIIGGGSGTASRLAPQLLTRLQPKGQSLGVALVQPTVLGKFTAGVSVLWDWFLSACQIATANYNFNMLVVVGGTLLILTYMLFNTFAPFETPEGGGRRRTRRQPYSGQGMGVMGGFPVVPPHGQTPARVTYEFPGEEQ